MTRSAEVKSQMPEVIRRYIYDIRRPFIRCSGSSSLEQFIIRLCAGLYFMWGHI